MMVTATDLVPRPDDLPRWRGRLERLWQRQVQQIIALSLAYHEAASADGAAHGRGPAGTPSRRLQQTLARAASAHQELAEIEAALARIDTARYGFCEQCGERLAADWLDVRPQLRYCRRCHPPQPGPRRPSGAAGVGRHDR